VFHNGAGPAFAISLRPVKVAAPFLPMLSNDEGSCRLSATNCGAIVQPPPSRDCSRRRAVNGRASRNRARPSASLLHLEQTLEHRVGADPSTDLCPRTNAPRTALLLTTLACLAAFAVVPVASRECQAWPSFSSPEGARRYWLDERRQAQRRLRRSDDAGRAL